MGALHEGHSSLIRKALKENNKIIVSVFVNPTQFSDPEDFLKYPRNSVKDLQILRDLKVDMVFMPDKEEMYPEDDHRTFDLYPLDTVMEGKYRKNHFYGVAQIVTKLFETITPDRAYFGQKDFQQLVIIKRLVAMMGYNIIIVSCPVIRESDGLAMSSRNMLLSDEERKIAPFIAQTLFRAREMKNELSPGDLTCWVYDQFTAHKEFQLEYFEIVDELELRKIEDWSDPVSKIGCIAVRLGKVRLIDNIIFN